MYNTNEMLWLFVASWLLKRREQFKFSSKERHPDLTFSYFVCRTLWLYMHSTLTFKFIQMVSMTLFGTSENNFFLFFLFLRLVIIGYYTLSNQLQFKPVTRPDLSHLMTNKICIWSWVWPRKDQIQAAPSFLNEWRCHEGLSINVNIIIYK